VGNPFNTNEIEAAGKYT